MKKIVLLGVLALFSLAGFAQAETLSLLTWKGYAPQVLVDKFEKETGIKVEVTYSNNEEMIAKLRATRGAGFDLAQPSQDRISSVQEKYKIYQAMDYAKINSDLFIPSMLNAVKKNTLVGDDSFAVPFCWGTSGMIVNSAKAPGANSWKALLDSKYEGRVSYRLKRPTLIAMGFALGYDPFALYSDAAAYKAMLDKIAETLIAAKPLVKNYWANGDALLESMRSEEVFVAMAWDAGGWKLHDDNAAIDFVAPQEGALAGSIPLLSHQKPKTLMLHINGLTLCSDLKMPAILLPQKNMAQHLRVQMHLFPLKFAVTSSALSRKQRLTISSGTRRFRLNWKVWKGRFLTRSRLLSNLNAMLCCYRDGFGHPCFTMQADFHVLAGVFWKIHE